MDVAAHCPGLDRELGIMLLREGHRVHVLDERKIITFPTRDQLLAPASLEIIRRSAAQLMAELDLHREIDKVYSTRPGCGIGGFTWRHEVRPAIQAILDDRIIILSSVGRPPR